MVENQPLFYRNGVNSGTLYHCCLQVTGRKDDDLEVGVHCTCVDCNLCVVDVPRAIFVTVDVDNDSLVHSANDYCQHSVLRSICYLSQIHDVPLCTV